MTAQVTVVSVPAPCEFTTEGRRFVQLNGSHGNPHAYQGQMNEWKSRAILAARKAGVQPVQPPVVITALVHRTTNAHSDAHNVTNSIKACIDAAVAVGVIPDDHDGYVRRLITERGPNMSAPAITIRVESVAPEKPKRCTHPTAVRLYGSDSEFACDDCGWSA